MGIFAKIKNRFKKNGRDVKRSYKGAMFGRLNSLWGADNLSEGARIRQDIASLRSRSRELFRDNENAKRFGDLVVDNVIGDEGVRFQSKIADDEGNSIEPLNSQIEKAWQKWGKKGNCDTSRRLSWAKIQKIVMRNMARDGEALIQIVRGFDNEDRFALRLLESDRLATEKNEISPNGNRIITGVEVNVWGESVAYHLYVDLPNNTGVAARNSQETIRVDASNIIHLYSQVYAETLRGVPWVHAAMDKLHQLDKFQESAIVAARVGAANAGVFQNTTGESYPGRTDGDEEETPGTMTMEPGTIQEIPVGWEIRDWSPDYPHAVYQPFLRTALLGTAAGMNVSYASLTGDLSDANFSSARVGLLEERRHWRGLQRDFIDDFCSQVFAAWFESWGLKPGVPVEVMDYDPQMFQHWIPRSWEWVDPVKDVDAAIKQVNNNLAPPSKFVDGDYEDTQRQIKRDNDTREFFDNKSQFEMELAAEKKEDEDDADE